jgi:hypothetical protein
MATRDKQALEEHGLIRSQMRLGVGLIAFGALSEATNGQAGTPSRNGR